jgi:hypothetical protein
MANVCLSPENSNEVTKDDAYWSQFSEPKTPMPPVDNHVIIHSSFLLHYGKSVHKIQQGNGVVRKLETALAEMNLVAEMVVLCTLFR